MDDNPLLTVALLILFVAVIGMIVLFIAGDLHDQGRTDASESFTVTDPGSDKVCSLDREPDETPVVRYYNGTAWSTLTSSDYTLVGSTLTVKSSAMD